MRSSSGWVLQRRGGNATESGTECGNTRQACAAVFWASSGPEGGAGMAESALTRRGSEAAGTRGRPLVVGDGGAAAALLDDLRSTGEAAVAAEAGANAETLHR